MRWRKLGRLLDPVKRASWMQSHAALPVAYALDDGLVRVCCSGRDADGRAQIGSIDVVLGERPRVVSIAPEPLLTFGPLGAFDDRGVLSASLVRGPDRWLLYFTGVMLGSTVPFYYAAGVAESDDLGLSWQKLSIAPMLDRNVVDPYLTASPDVLLDDGLYRMWYTSGQSWTMDDGAPKHRYNLRYASSNDGVTWNRDGRVAIDFAPGEYAISRPTVVRDADCYRMWFASRGRTYEIQYAESGDGLTWTRKGDALGLECSTDGWDSEMVCYPFVFDHTGTRYMFYNGNGYGATGLGVAVLDR